LPEWIRSYLTFHRALGKKYYRDQLNLRNLDNFLQAEGVRSPHVVSSQLIEAWYDSQPGVWRTRYEKIRGVYRFFKYLQAMEVIAANPVPSTLLETRRGVPRLYPPYIFTIEQISAILSELRRQPTDGFTPWHAETCHTMAALQYALGLRHGELRRLRIRDVDFSRKTLFIDRTKFYKNRCLPFGPRVEKRLEEFMQVRRSILAPIRDDHPLFVAWWRTPLCVSVYYEAFRLALKTLNITGHQGRAPRTHDLRHSFAVHRLSRWYRDGVDVQSRLPWLSTFLGHVDIQSTEVYLTITADLYEQASARFYRCFGQDLETGGGDV
jgi:integrase